MRCCWACATAVPRVSAGEGSAVLVESSLAGRLLSVLEFHYDCDGVTLSVLRPERCLQLLSNSVSDKMGVATGIAYDMGQVRLESSEYSFGKGLNNGVKDLYRCVEEVCKESLGQ